MLFYPESFIVSVCIELGNQNIVIHANGKGKVKQSSQTRIQAPLDVEDDMTMVSIIKIKKMIMVMAVAVAVENGPRLTTQKLKRMLVLEFYLFFTFIKHTMTKSNTFSYCQVLSLVTHLLMIRNVEFSLSGALQF